MSPSMPAAAGEVIHSLYRAAVDRAATMRRPPESTYRVQFHAGFTFRDAAAIVPYLANLGVTHLYASPYLAAAAGSTHGYDVIDPSRLNPELGAADDYEALLAALREHGMSHILDTVPNHAGVATNDNPWWNDVLENGPASKYGNFFDIAWTGSPRPHLHGKVLLPLLGGPYGDVLEKGELQVVFNADAGKCFVQYYDRQFPLSPETCREILRGSNDTSEVEQILRDLNGAPGDAASFDRLDALLERQHYRLAYWRTAPDEINYRRFFDINDLAALAMERPEVFEAAHALILPRLARGDIGGLRIDHPDGLYDPARYFLRLQQHYLLAIAREVAASDPQFGGVDWDVIRPRLLEHIEREVTDGQSVGGQWPLYVTVEKILAPGEPLPSAWAVDGTSGYDFLNMVNGLFVDPAGEEPMTALYRDWTGDETPFDELAYRQKKLILETALSSELHMLAHELDRLAQRDRHSRDFTLAGLITALREAIACFPVYRSYIDQAGVSEIDRQRIESAVDAARERNPKLDSHLFAFVCDTLLLRFGDRFTEADRAAQRKFAGKFQQLTAPATAKGVEDTAFYLYNRLLSLNEVGGEPAQFGVAPDALHAYFAERKRDWPYALSALSTHDTKRGEDVRARLNVLSEIPDEWRERVMRWGDLNAPHRTHLDGQPVPDRNDEYAIYQTIVGAWPVEPMNPDEFDAFVERIRGWATKAMREAKRHTTWTDPDERYESGVTSFIDAILNPSSSEAFRRDLRPFRERVSQLGLLNSLSQTLLKLTTPGVPDTYQGSELLNLSLVDPDNRRPVDYAERCRALDGVRAPVEAQDDDRPAALRQLLDSADKGFAKLLVHQTALACRRRHPGLFTVGEYLPLEVQGAHAKHVFAFARHLENIVAVVVVPRLAASVSGAEGLPFSLAGIGSKTRVVLPQIVAERSFDNVISGVALKVDSGSGGPTAEVADLLVHFPVALLLSR